MWGFWSPVRFDPDTFCSLISSFTDKRKLYGKWCFRLSVTVLTKERQVPGSTLTRTKIPSKYVCQQIRVCVRACVRAWNERNTQLLVFKIQVFNKFYFYTKYIWNPTHHFLRWAVSLTGKPPPVSVERMYSGAETRSFMGEYKWVDYMLSTPDTLF